MKAQSARVPEIKVEEFKETSYIAGVTGVNGVNKDLITGAECGDLAAVENTR
ncbi:hypothetical protein SBDP2_240013 [Syntrophobacter sp. SbD2]|nr:hypothetical protein SBDP2_240013 [Syntrophobacter sp. SbD2]